MIHIRAAESHVFTGDKMLYACLAAGADIAHPIVWGFQFDDDQSFNYSNYDFGSFSLNLFFSCVIFHKRYFPSIRGLSIQRPSPDRIFSGSGNNEDNLLDNSIYSQSIQSLLFCSQVGFGRILGQTWDQVAN